MRGMRSITLSVILCSMLALSYPALEVKAAVRADHERIIKETAELIHRYKAADSALSVIDRLIHEAEAKQSACAEALAVARAQKAVKELASLHQSLESGQLADTAIADTLREEWQRLYSEAIGRLGEKAVSDSIRSWLSKQHVGEISTPATNRLFRTLTKSQKSALDQVFKTLPTEPDSFEYYETQISRVASPHNERNDTSYPPQISITLFHYLYQSHPESMMLALRESKYNDTYSIVLEKEPLWNLPIPSQHGLWQYYDDATAYWHAAVLHFEARAYAAIVEGTAPPPLAVMMGMGLHHAVHAKFYDRARLAIIEKVGTLAKTHSKNLNPNEAEIESIVLDFVHELSTDFLKDRSPANLSTDPRAAAYRRGAAFLSSVNNNKAKALFAQIAASKHLNMRSNQLFHFRDEVYRANVSNIFTLLREIILTVHGSLGASASRYPLPDGFL